MPHLRSYVAGDTLVGKEGVIPSPHFPVPCHPKDCAIGCVDEDLAANGRFCDLFYR